MKFHSTDSDALLVVADLAATEADRDEWKEVAEGRLLNTIERAEKAEAEVKALREQLAETEADLRSHGYKRDIALDVARKAETEVAALREELADYRAYYEWVNGGNLADPSITEPIARIEARREAEK